MQKILIIGGGVIGLCSAYYLNKAGFEVTVLDKNGFDDNCSFGNAGMIVPSHFVPLAAPGMVEQGIRWMFDSKSPFYVRPSFNLDLVKWGWKFLKSANKQNVEKAAIPLRDLSLLSKSLYQELEQDKGFDFGLHNNGILMLYKTEKTGEEEIHMAQKAIELGLHVEVLNPDQCCKLQPELQIDVAGAVYYRCDAFLTPQLFMKQLASVLEENNVKLIRDSEAIKIQRNGNTITKVYSATNEYEADHVIISGGAWSADIARLVNLNLPLMPGKGYSFMFDEPEKRMSVAALLMEARVSVTPMGNQIRFGGTMELGPVDHRININRVKGIVEAIPKYLPDFKPQLPAEASIWHGFRPCSPDGLPYIGRVKSYSNLLVAAGHGMMGLSLGPATGKLVSELVAGKATSMSVDSFSPDRFQ